VSKTTTTRNIALPENVYVGRIGALAAALGIGIFISLSSPVAAAESGQDAQASDTTPRRANVVHRAEAKAAPRDTAVDSPVPLAAAVRGQRRVGIAPVAAKSAAPNAAVASAASVPTLTPRTPDVFAPNLKGVVYGGARIGNVGAGALTFSAPVTTVNGGTVSINPTTGAFSYTPTRTQRQNAGLTTTDTFTITATNGRGATATQVVTVPVDPGTPIPSTPWVREPDSYTGVVIGISKFSDESGRSLAFTAPATTTGGATVAINPTTGAFTYTPTKTQRQAAGLATTDSFTVTVDNGVRTATQVINVAVDPGTPFANTPWVRSPNRTTGVVTGLAKFVEPSGRTLTYSVGKASNGQVSINPTTGEFTYTPDPGVRPAAAPAATYRWQFIEQNMGAGQSGWTWTNAQPGGIFDGRYSQSQVFDVVRSAGCAEGGTCTVSRFEAPYVGSYTNMTRASWAEGDYVQLVRTDEILQAPWRTAANGWGITLFGNPNISLRQYSSDGTEKQVLSRSGYVQSIGDGILYIGDPANGGGTGYFLSNSVGINPETQSSYTFQPTVSYPTLSQLYSYKASTIPLGPGQTPKPTTDTFVITASNGIRTATQTVTVPIA
jgi:VCBS repeat-containing protein